MDAHFSILGLVFEKIAIFFYLGLFLNFKELKSITIDGRTKYGQICNLHQIINKKVAIFQFLFYFFDDTRFSNCTRIISKNTHF